MQTYMGEASASDAAAAAAAAGEDGDGQGTSQDAGNTTTTTTAGSTSSSTTGNAAQLLDKDRAQVKRESGHVYFVYPLKKSPGPPRLETNCFDKHLRVEMLGIFSKGAFLKRCTAVGYVCVCCV